ncbi:MAG: hypothetical protein OXQ94_15855 [Gemmatimonadota bacterium]|nr:hypothetical protein [Gemmatimonadota bacterium]MDE2873153.1 hypothetical protein [Gemmatimonadota bacterium]
MKHFVERTCAVVRGHEEERGGEAESGRRGETGSHPLEAFREVPAYVLLGPPGAGKTEAFRREARWEGIEPVTARDFWKLLPRPEWRGKTIYIDGLDEVRAGSADGTTPFDGIRTKLQELGFPRFRLSCREADWFGANDRERLSAVAPNRVVQVLRLDPLSDHGVLEILRRNHDVEDPEAFVAQAGKQGVEDLLRNPQNLRMLVAAVAEADPARQCRGQGGATEWPRTRAETFDMACRRLVSEENPEHQIALNGEADTESRLAAAGGLCALLLLAGKAGVTLPGAAPDSSHPRLDQIPGGNRQLLRHAVSTGLFAMPSGGPEGRLAPGHRQIAEYLAARQLAARIARGLPVGRVLALMTGFDGGIVSECRGLAAWLAALSIEARAEIVERDPLGVLLYGDARQFGPDDKRLVLRALRGEIHRNPRLASYSSADPPLQPLVGPDLEDDMRQALTDPARDEAHQSIARLICEAIRDAAPRPGLADPLMAVVRDDSWPTHIRRTALEAYIRARQDDPGVSVTLRTLLDDVYTNVLATEDDDLLGTLMAELYPEDLSVADVVNYLRQPARRNPWTRYDRFWTKGLIEKSTVRQMVQLLDSLQEPMEKLRAECARTLKRPHLVARTPNILLRRVIDLSPESVSLERIVYWFDFAAWLELSLGGVVRDAAYFRKWLSERPAVGRKLRGEVRLGRFFEATLQDLREEGGSLKGRRSPPRARPPRNDGRFDELRDLFKKNESSLRANECRANLLHTLATAYFNGFSDVVGETPEERLRHLLGADGDLVEAALAGLRGAIRRPDLPKWTEVSKLAAEGRTHYLAYPFMAGLQELSAAAATGDCRLGDSQARLALAIHFALPRMGQADDSRHPPRWLRDCVAREPDTVADVWSHCARGRLGRGEPYLPDAGRLAREREYARLAQAASLPLLNAFPIRCRAGQLPILSSLLAAGVAHGARTQLLGLVETKLAYRSMNSSQRVHWLTAGLLLQPGAYCDRLASYVSGNVRRIQRLTEMIHEPAVLRALADRMDATAVETLIRLIGPYTTGPPDTDRFYRVTWPIQADETIHSFIDRLSEDASEAAGKALDSLAGDDRLARWRSRLLDRLHRQKSVRREADFSHPSLERVAEVLDNGRPANAADLAALVVGFLQRIGRDIRDGANSSWKGCWNLDRYDRPTRSGRENACRRVLLDLLRPRLDSLGIDAQPGGRYADDKRADVRVSYGGFNIPVEIKRSCHRELWSAIHTQLIAGYVRDPGADGYGIYLVFWFGDAEGCRPTPRLGPWPRSSEELRRALLDSLSEAERRKISVCVIDVSNPRSRAPQSPPRALTAAAGSAS